MLPFLLALLSATAHAEDIRTTDGTVYKNATISRVEKDGINVIHATGAAKIPFEKLPPAIQQRHGYNPAAAAEYRATVERARKAEEENRRLALERAEAERKLAVQKKADDEARSAREKQAVADAERRKQRNADLVSSARVIGIVLVCGFIYFLPSMVGARKENALAIFVLNLLAGWTFVGWVIAAVWACTRDRRT